jgi:putative membrane protein
MHTGKSYTLPEFLFWTRRTIYVLVVLAVVPVVLYQLAGVKWIAIPWGVVFLLGATVALSAGFKNLQTYNRMQEAQQVWSSIASASRIWGVMCRDLVTDRAQARALVLRHLAWLTALRHEMRHAKAWENLGKAYNTEYRRNYSIPERENTLESDLARFLSPDEAARVLTARNKALQASSLQGQAVKQLSEKGVLAAGSASDLYRVNRELLDLQGRSERIKNFPYPRQHAFINSLFVWILCILLPFGMIGEFERLNDVVDGWAKGNMVWLGIPLSLLICWMYTSLDQVGESTENPFEGGANDVPISRICQEIEVDLREMLGETGLPPQLRAVGDIAM